MSLLTVNEAAKSLTLSPWTLRKWLSEKRLSCVRLGRRIAIEPREIDRLIAAGRTKDTAPNDSPTVTPTE